MRWLLIHWCGGMGMGLLGKIFGSKESKQEKKEEKLIGVGEKPAETVGALESEPVEERPVETMQSEPITEEKSEPVEKEEEPKEPTEPESMERKSAESMENEPEPVEVAPEPPESSAPHKEERAQFINLDGEEVISAIIAGRFQVLDVRTPREYESHRIPGSTLIPLQQLDSRYTELDPSREILVVCEHGIRSQDACLFLSEMGFKRLYHLIGGLSAYRGPQEGKMFR